MIYKKFIFRAFSLVCLLFCFSKTYSQEELEGTWQATHRTSTETLVFIDGYVSHVVFDIENKEFISTRGGQYRLDKNRLSVTWHYDTEKAEKKIPLETWLGKESDFTLAINNKELQTNFSNQNHKWTKKDGVSADLSGLWRMSGRKQGEEISTIPLRDRRTLKILTGTRFQWVAINIKTGEFFGTGGGKYTFENGKYTEHIEFFSRNNARVGAELTFQGEVKGDQWHHSGSSSSGDFIYEIWEKLQE